MLRNTAELSPRNLRHFSSSEILYRANGVVIADLRLLMSLLLLCPRYERCVSSKGREPLVGLRLQILVIYSLLPQPHTSNWTCQVFTAKSFRMCV